MLEVRRLTSQYGRIAALHGVDLSVSAGELVAIVGANGAGKTTLLRTISGVHRASGGTIVLGDIFITAMPAERRVRLGIAHVQEGRQIFGSLTVEDNLVLGAYLRSRAQTRTGLETVYDLFPMLAERRRISAGSLSGGQQQMLAIGRAMMSGPKLLLLDEPSMGLSPRLIEEVYAAIDALRRAHTTILLVEQNAMLALGVADRGYVLETGQITLTDHGHALLLDQKVKAAYLGQAREDPGR